MSDLGKTRILVIAAGSVGLAAVAVLGGGIASASGGHTSSTASSTTTKKASTSTATTGTATTSSAAAAQSTATPRPRPTGTPAAGPRTQGRGPGGGPGGGPGDGHGGGPGAGPGGSVVHGRDVVKSGTTYTTVDSQEGTVTAVSATSLTVLSSDSFSETYVLTSATKYGRNGTAADIAVGDTVHVRATVSGDTATATSVDEHKAPTATPTATATP